MQSNNIRHRNSTIAEIQTDLVTRQIIKEANSQNNIVNLPMLQRILSEIEANGRLEFPFFVPYLLNENVLVDRDQHNSAIRYLKTDISTLREALGIVNWKLNKIDRAIDRSYKMILSGTSKIDEAFRSLRTSVGLSRFTFKEEFINTNAIDLSLTNAEIDTDKKQVVSKRSNMFDGNIKIGPLSSDLIQAINDDNGILAVDSNFYQLFVPGNNRTSNVQVVKTKRETTEIRIVATLSDISNLLANMIVIRTAHKTGTRCSIAITSDGETKNVISNAILLNSTYSFQFPFGATKVDKIIITMAQDVETTISPEGNYLYHFMIDFISPELVNYTNDVNLVSSEINVPFTITDVSINAEDLKPEGTDIQYYVSTNQESWIEIVPRNQTKAVNNVINIGSRIKHSIAIKDEIGIPAKDDFWYKLTPLEAYGNNTLYNILEYVTVDGILSGQLDVETNMEIVPGSVKLYRGYNDYSIQMLKYETSITIQDVLYRLEPPSLDGVSLDNDFLADEIKTDLFTRIEGESHTIDFDGKIKVNYNICNSNILVTDLITNKELTILSYTGNEISLTGVAANTKVSVIYHTLLSTIEATDNVIITIDPLSVGYKFNDQDTQFVNGTDVIVIAPNKTLKFNILNSIPGIGSNNWKTFYLTFSYTKKAREEYKLFTTYIYYEEDTTIQILPFTEEEIIAGNIHMIDGVVVSRSEQYKITGGLHEFITTQPFKTDPNNLKDVNYLTGKPSEAGIVLGDYLYRRAFKKSMRQVSLFALANIIPPKNTENFAIDNNKILLNFIPEYLPDYANDIANHLMGKSVMLKEVVYEPDSKLTFDQYTTFDEQLLIEYDTHPKEGSVDDLRTIYVKAVLKPNKKTHVSPTIYSYELLAY